MKQSFIRRKLNAKILRFFKKISNLRKDNEFLVEKEKKLKLRLNKAKLLFCESQRKKILVQKVAKFFIALKFLRVLKTKDRQNKKLAYFFNRKKVIGRVFATILKITNTKKINNEVSKNLSKQKLENEQVIFKLNNHMCLLSDKINELEEKLNRTNAFKENIQQKIQEAFITGFNTLNSETEGVLEINSYPKKIENKNLKNTLIKVPEINNDNSRLSNREFINKMEIIAQLAGGKEYMGDHGGVEFGAVKIETKDHLWKPVASLNPKK